MARKRYAKKKYYHRRHKKNSPKVNIGIQVPESSLVKFKYNFSKTLTVTASPTIYVNKDFRLNSIFEPEVGETKHQPLGADQWSNFYRKYRVYRVAMHIELCSQNGTSTVSLFPYVDSTYVPVGQLNLCEQPQSKICLLSQNSQSKKCRFTYHLPNLLGQTKQQYKDDPNNAALLENVIGGNPETFCRLGLFLFTPGQVTATIYYNISFVYYTELFDRINLQTSAQVP